jgi:hypothetical protein
MAHTKQETNPLFEQMKSGILSIDPVAFCETYLTLDGLPFRINGNGYKPFSDIYRYIGIKALEKDSKPVVIVKGRQVGATTMAAALELFFTCSSLFGKNGRPPMRIMHCFPLLEMGYRYTKQKLNTMIRGAVPDTTASKKTGKTKSYVEGKLDKSSTANDSISFKQFENGNLILIESTGQDSQRLRGITADSLFFDEAQNIPLVALSNATKSLTKAQYGPDGTGVQVYFGTPLQKGTGFHKLWKVSSQQYYHLGCEECGDVFPLYTPESDDWMKIWIEDDLPPQHPGHGFQVRCTKCGHIQDKRGAAERGKWVASNEDQDYQYVGFHLNQLYMPTLNRDYIIGQRPENHPYNTERAYQNEVMGEFYSGQSFLITADELQTKCGDLNRHMSSRIEGGKNKLVFAGFDWGEKISDFDQTSEGESRARGQSYSTVIVLSVDGPDLLSIEYAKILKSNDPAYKKSVVDTAMARYAITLAVSDIGHSEDLSKILAKEYGHRFIVSRAAGDNIKNNAKYMDDIFPREIIFARNFWIDEIIGEYLRKGKIRFPMGSYEQIMWLLNHISSMELKLSTDSFGSTKVRYIKGSTPNDGFMALLNAFLAYKFYISDGFKKNDPRTQQDPTKKRQIPAILGHVPMGIHRINR